MKSGLSSGICPRCGETVDYATAIWFYQEKYYCSERCVAITQGRIKLP